MGMASQFSFSFYPPVSIEFGGAGYPSSHLASGGDRVPDERRLARLWPQMREGALLSATQGHMKPGVARQAFVEAAIEAHLLAM